MNRYGRLAKNSGIFAIANLGSHLITFVLVRFYTELLTSEQYGIIDFVVTTSSMLIPFLTMAITEAVLRFSIDQEEKSDIFTNGIFMATLGSVLFLIIGPAFFQDTSYEQYFIYLAILVFSSSINMIMAQFARGMGKVTIFAIAGIIKTLALVCGNMFFLLCLGWGIEGYLLSVILSELASAVYLACGAQLYRFIRLKCQKRLLKEMLRYSIPLMPNSLSWWVMNAADKYVILACLGSAANGIYAVAHKIPTLINFCNNIFFQAWQLSAVQEASSETKTEFYSHVFNVLAAMLCVVASILILLVKPLTRIMVASSYGDVWLYTPFLIIAMVFSAFASFLGTNYVAMKETKGALVTSFGGASVNIALNLLLVGPYGINGTAIATMVSFLVMWLLRAYDTRKFVSIKYDYWQLGISSALLVLQAVITIYDHTLWMSLLCTVAILAIQSKYIIQIVQKFCQIISKKVKR